MGIVIDRARRLATVGQIRIGAEKGEKAPGKALETFRFTSRFPDKLQRLAEQYGGEVVPWGSKPGHWQLYSQASSVPCYFSTRPVGEGGDTESVSRILEFRDREGNLMRSCDGARCKTWQGGSRVEVPCLCASEGSSMCTVRSRLTVILPAVPDFGGWQLVTGSQVFDQELDGMLAACKSLIGESHLLPALLTITFRHKETAPGQKAGKFPVVVISADPNPKPLAQFAHEIRGVLTAGVNELGELPVGPSALPRSLTDDEWLLEIANQNMSMVRDWRSWLDGAGIDIYSVVAACRHHSRNDADSFMFAANKLIEQAAGGVE